MEAPYLTWYLLVPLILSLLAFAARWLKRGRRLAVEVIHIVSISAVLVFSIITVRDVLTLGTLFALGYWLFVDTVGALFLILIGVVGFLAGLYSIGYTRHDLETGELDLSRLTVYYGLFNLFLFTMLLVV